MATLDFRLWQHHLIHLLIATYAFAHQNNAQAARVGFEEKIFRVPGELISVTRDDLDGDGLEDILVVYKREQQNENKKFIAIFFREAGGLPNSPNLAFSALKDAAIYDLGQLNDAPGAELVYLTDTGIWAQSFSGRTPTPVQKLKSVLSLVARPQDDRLVAWDFARSLVPTSTHSQDLLIIPDRRALKLYNKAPSGEFEEVCRMRINQTSSYRAQTSRYSQSRGGGSENYAFRVTTTIPKFSFIEATGDTNIDLVTHFEDKISIHQGTPGGCFESIPSLRQNFRIRSAEELRTGAASVSVQFADLDEDGISDLALTKISGGLTNLRTETRLHKGLRGGGFEPKAKQVFSTSGYGAFVSFKDIDGDGQIEMVQPYAAISILGMTRILLSSSISVDILIRRSVRSADVFFETKPIQKLTTSFGFDFDSPNSFLGALPIFGYDFNGDGEKDALLSKGQAAMGLHLGQKKKEPFESRDRFGFEGPGSIATLVLNPGLGLRSELLVWYPGRKGLADKFRIYRPTLPKN